MIPKMIKNQRAPIVFCHQVASGKSVELFGTIIKPSITDPNVNRSLPEASTKILKLSLGLPSHPLWISTWYFLLDGPVDSTDSVSKYRKSSFYGCFLSASIQSFKICRASSLSSRFIQKTPRRLLKDLGDLNTRPNRSNPPDYQFDYGHPADVLRHITEAEGFEPSDRLPRQLLSRQLLSAAQPRLLCRMKCGLL